MSPVPAIVVKASYFLGVVISAADRVSSETTTISSDYITVASVNRTNEMLDYSNLWNMVHSNLKNSGDWLGVSSVR